jgi:hypothetical protein
MTFLEELTAAARGCWALLLGRRNAPSYFDFSQRGLVTSFIAFLFATALNAYLPILLRLDLPAGSITRDLVTNAVLFVLQVGFAALVLRQLGRLDGLVPYLVADNWATFFVTALSLVLMITGFPAEVTLIAVGILVIIVEINIARLVVTLSPLQIAMFLIAQMVGLCIGLLILTVVYPLPPEALEAMANAANQ